MLSKTLTIGETIKQLHEALCAYIEATYHISNPALIAQRRKLLDAEGVIHQRPFLETTPRYKGSDFFATLGLDEAAVDILSVASSTTDEAQKLIHDPPYHHQAETLVQVLSLGKSAAVVTGTGSGKTECFLLPILAKLAIEACHHPETFAKSHAVRALVLYPMNALVNDQLGRMRLLFGDTRVSHRFTEWSGRPARFARYTSRTLYPGVRDVTKDQINLKPFRDFYLKNLEVAAGPPSQEQERAQKLIAELKAKGKWPAKPDLPKWYGEEHSRWVDQTGAFRRCVTLPDDAELLTRHEVFEAPPDILVTNYSMLEYMLMRPLERPVFDKTREWLAENPDEKFLLVVDEAHLYRGAAGTEVALLLRRLRARLDIPAERMQVICTSASFQDHSYASQFAAQLTGKSPDDFVAITGQLQLHEGEAPGSLDEAEALARVDMQSFFSAEDDAARLESVHTLLEYRGTPVCGKVDEALFAALTGFPPLALLTNRTMKQACALDELPALLFPNVEDELAARALTALLALASVARPSADQPGMLPCRIHSFHRGLTGLWACMDPKCPVVPQDQKGGPTGMLYSQPRDVCECGARVLELYTCRNCGTAYGRA